MNIRIGKYRYEAYAQSIKNCGWRPFAQRYYSGRMLKIFVGPVVVSLARWPRASGAA